MDKKWWQFWKVRRKYYIVYKMENATGSVEIFQTGSRFLDCIQAVKTIEAAFSEEQKRTLKGRPIIINYFRVS